MSLSLNLKALAQRSPRLAARLEAGGTPIAVASLPWPELPEAPLVMLVGAATPAGVRAALDAGRKLWLWERSAPILRAFLEAVDVSDALKDGRLRLACDVDLLTLSLPPCTPIVAHPLLGPRYARELAFLGAAPQRRALIVEGGLMIEELCRSLTERGFAVWTWESARLPPAELTRIALAVRPEVVLAVNHQPGLPEAIEALAAQLPGLSLKVWEVDPAIDPVRPPATRVPRTTIYTYRRVQVERFQSAGYRAEWLPLASDPDWRQPMVLTPAEHAEFDAPVVFVGRSMLIEAQAFRRDLLQRMRDARTAAGLDPAGAEAVLDQVVAAQRTELGRFVVPEKLAALAPELGAFEAGIGRRSDPAMLAGEIAAAEHRLTVLANLGRFGAQVWGDAGWKPVERYGVRYRGPAGHHQQLPRIYSNGGIQIDIGRLYQSDIVTLRVFDVLACGGFLITPHTEDLPALFRVGEELETYRTVAELCAKVEHYASRPDDRARIAAAGHARVLSDHTVRQRLERMLG